MNTDGGRPTWAARIRSERKARRWPAEEMARRLRDAADPRTRAQLPSHDNLVTYIRRWERGDNGVSERYQMLYARAFGVDEDDLFGHSETVEPSRNGDDESVELLEFVGRAEVSDVGTGTLDALYGAVDRLCRDYPTMPAPQLRDRCKATMRYVLGLLDGRTTLAQHRELLVSAGWLAALLGCVEYDTGDQVAAEVARRMTRRLGEQAGHGVIVAWSWEMAAWFALMEGRYGETVEFSETGLQHAGTSSAAVQLALQAGRGYARMGDSEARTALKTGRAVLDQLPTPDHPEHHFVFDGSKYEFYVATILTWLGKDNAAAEEHAREVIRQCEESGGWPTRLGTTRINLGLLAGRRGDLDEAVELGTSALWLGRRSAELVPRAEELCHELADRYPREPIVAAYRGRLVEERRALPPA